MQHRHKRILLSLALFWLSSYVAGRHLAVAPQSGAKQFFYCSVYYLTLNLNCEAQRAPKNCRRFEAKNNARVI
jgi:hypothetical protein